MNLPGNSNFPPGFSAVDHARRFGDPPPIKKTICPVCDGDRVVLHEDGERDDCPRCNGAGTIPLDQP